MRMHGNGRARCFILADRTKDSTKKDTRIGLGKSTLIDVLHFCLGGKLTAASSRLPHLFLASYGFSLESELWGKIFSVTRRIDNPSFVVLARDITGVPLLEDRGKKFAPFSAIDWTRFLGQYWLGIPVDIDRNMPLLFAAPSCISSGQMGTRSAIR